MITIRGAWADIFWFSLFHESVTSFSMTGRNNLENVEMTIRIHSARERSGCVCQDTLIQPAAFQKFVAGAISGRDDPCVFPDLSIDPGIIVGRLQHDGH
jgi:HTH-type transcriptional regulator/antitoxin HigA